MKIFKSICQEICQDDKLKIGILIAGNYLKAIESIEVIPSKEGGPQAFLAILSWCTVSSVEGKIGQPSLHCNIIKCSSVSTSKMAKHFLALETQAEDTGIKQNAAETI